MKYFFLDVISSPAVFVCFDEDKKICQQQSVPLGQREYDVFLENLEAFFTVCGTKKEDIWGISVLVGPGSFTGMRIITLTLNTLQLVNSIPLEGMNYFDFLQESWVSFPFLLWANRQEVLIKEDVDSDAYFLATDKLERGDFFGSKGKLILPNEVCVNENVPYNVFIENHHFLWKNDFLKPVYIKKPNIT